VDYPVPWETAVLLPRWHNSDQAGQVQASRASPEHLEDPMRNSARAMSADEYIRRVDRMLVITSTVVVALAVGLILQIA
jgi:hypothetical protein